MSPKIPINVDCPECEAILRKVLDARELDLEEMRKHLYELEDVMIVDASGAAAVKIMDFGQAKVVDAGTGAARPNRSSPLL